jgi:NhaP-type Na+/H+ or K+/H+ antiporter
VDLVALFALAAVVLGLSALSAGLIEKAPLSHPMIFLGLGLLLGDGATGAVALDLDNQALQATAFSTLALVLFLDGLNLELAHTRHDWVVPALSLGPGTLLVIVLTAVAAMLIAGLEPVLAFIVGAVLASTDPVVLRDVLADRRIPGPVRSALRVEGATNDLIVLPPVLVLAAVAASEASNAGGWIGLVAELLIVGPACGALVGVAGAYLMSAVDERHPVRREWQAIYGVGLVLGAFAAGETAGADGFLAAFAAGAAVSLSNRTMCDCFLDFGEVIAELLMLVSFVLFGAVLSAQLDTVDTGEALALAAVAVLVIRPLALGTALSLRPTALSREGKVFVSWFGPRGLNSLLLALLVVEAGVPEGGELFPLIGFVVMCSIAVHGVTATPLSAWYARRLARETHPEERESTATQVLRASPGSAPRISAARLAALLEGDDPPLVVDVRSRAGFEREPFRIPGAIRVRPDDVADWAATQERDRLIALYCT